MGGPGSGRQKVHPGPTLPKLNFKPQRKTRSSVKIRTERKEDRASENATIKTVITPDKSKPTEETQEKVNDDRDQTWSGVSGEEKSDDDELSTPQSDDSLGDNSNSSLSEAHPETFDFLERADTKMLKPPALQQFSKETNDSVDSEKMHHIHVRFRKILTMEGKEVKIVDHFKTLLSRMIHDVPNLLLIPFDLDSKENHILYKDVMFQLKSTASTYT